MIFEVETSGNINDFEAKLKKLQGRTLFKSHHRNGGRC